MTIFLLAAALVSLAPVHVQDPNRQPQLATAGGLTALVFGSGSSIWISTSRDDGHSFSPPKQVASVPILALGRHRGPRVAISGKTIVVSAICGETIPAKEELMAWRSTDGGNTWSKPTIINDSPAAAREGLHAITVGPNGQLAAVWLDLREKGTRLYGSYSNDAGVSWLKNSLIYQSPGGTICQCCDPSIVATGPGKFSVMFRNVADGMRDMYLTEWNTAGKLSEPEKLGKGSWAIDACPMDGGGVALLHSKKITAWRRDQTVYLDELGQAEVPLGEGKDVALAVSAKGPYVAWTNTAGIEIHQPSQSQPTCLSPKGSFPALTELSNGSILAAWEQDGNINTQVIN